MQRLSQVGFLVGVAALLCSLLTGGGDAFAKGAKARSKSSGSSTHSDKESSSGTNLHISTAGSRSGGSNSTQPAAASAGAGSALSPAALATSNTQSADYEARKAQYLAEKAAQAGAPLLLGSAVMTSTAGTKTTATGPNIVTLPAGGAGQLFRITDAAGRVTFTDKVPNQAGMKVIEGLGTRTLLSGAADAFSNLPSALAGPVGKFPVMLYSTNNCTPCTQARDLLRSRGIPFHERTVRSPSDAEALTRITGGDSTMPLLTVGGQQIKGFSDVEYNQTLDAAEYPKANVLPATFRFPVATALTSTATAAAAVPASEAAAPNAPAGLRDENGNAISLRGARTPRGAAPGADDAATPPAPTNPAGIRF